MALIAFCLTFEAAFPTDSFTDPAILLPCPIEAEGVADGSGLPGSCCAKAAGESAIPAVRAKMPSKPIIGFIKKLDERALIIAEQVLCQEDIARKRTK